MGVEPKLCDLLVNHKITFTELLAEHLSEIRGLRQRLEQSIATNDGLREKLENRLRNSSPASKEHRELFSPYLLRPSNASVVHLLFIARKLKDLVNVSSF